MTAIPIPNITICGCDVMVSKTLRFIDLSIVFVCFMKYINYIIYNSTFLQKICNFSTLHEICLQILLKIDYFDIIANSQNRFNLNLGHSKDDVTFSCFIA